MRVSINNLTKQVRMAIRVDEVAFVAGSPAMGKSAVFAQCAKDLNLKFLDERLSEKEPTDFTGFPSIDEVKNKATYIPFENFPLEGDPLPFKEDGTQYDGWLISFEEINSVNPSLQASAYKILHDRMVGDKKLHPAVRFVANGNLESDGAVVMPMSSALASRMFQIETYVDPNEWLKWAMEDAKATLFHPLVLAYLNFEKSHVYAFDSKSKDKAFAAPRTWAKVSKVLFELQKQGNLLQRVSEYAPLIAGAVSEAVYTKFQAFLSYFSQVPSISDIVNGNPKPIEGLGIKYACALNIANNFEVKHAKPLLDYCINLDGNDEYLLMVLRMLIRKPDGMSIVTDTVVNKYIQDHASTMFAKVDFTN